MTINRKQFIQLSAAASALCVSPAFLFGAKNDKLRSLLDQAGNATNEKERAAFIEKAMTLDSVTPEEHQILEKLYYVADHWANGTVKYAVPGTEGNESQGYLCSFFNYKCKIDRYLLFQVDEGSVFSPLTSLYRGRMLIAQMIQNGGISQNKTNRAIYTNEGSRLLRIASEAYPENKLAKAYLGKYKEWESPVKLDVKAPEWANIQREILHKLSWIIHWWVDNRQIEDGQFGGGWGDDVEMWRHWTPVLFGFHDEKAVASQEKLFEGLFGLSKMSLGYTTALNDVEHTSEEYADPLTCMLNMQPNNPVWAKRTMRVFQYIKNDWSGINKRGQLQFKSTYFTSERIDLSPKRACDSPYHTRLVQPLMLLWLRNGDKELGGFLKNWLRTWVKAAFTEEGGKPYGIMPAAIHWPSGKPMGTGKNWWQPENYHTALYDYPSQQASMYECMLQAYYISREESFLKPIKFAADQLLEGKGSDFADSYQTGSFEWALAKVKGTVAQILFKYKTITGDDSYDRLIQKQGVGYEKYLFDKDINQLTSSLKGIQKALSLPPEFYTTEVRWTDRLFAFSKNYLNNILEKPIPGFKSATLFSTLTGSIGDFKILPVFGVKWMTPPKDLAVLVNANTGSEFRAELYHFGNAKRKMGAKFYNLEPGKYDLHLNDKVIPFELNKPGDEVPFELPPGQLVNMIVKQTS